MIAGGALACGVWASAHGTVVFPGPFEGEVAAAARIGLVEVVKVEPFGITDDGRKIDCGRIVEVSVLKGAKGGLEPFRFSMLLGSERLEPGMQGVVFVFPVSVVEEPSGPDRQILAKIGALHRLLCHRAGGPLAAGFDEQTFWRLARDVEMRLGGSWIEVSEQSFLWSPKDGRILEGWDGKRRLLSVEGVLQRVRDEIEPG